MPALYPGRTRHYHVKVQAPQQPVLTTQLYFPDEPGNSRDGLFRRELVMRMAEAGDGLSAQFAFVLDLALRRGRRLNARANCAENATPDLNLRRVAFPVTGTNAFVGWRGTFRSTLGSTHLSRAARLNPRQGPTLAGFFFRSTRSVHPAPVRHARRASAASHAASHSHATERPQADAYRHR